MPHIPISLSSVGGEKSTREEWVLNNKVLRPKAEETRQCSQSKNVSCLINRHKSSATVCPTLYHTGLHGQARARRPSRNHTTPFLQKTVLCGRLSQHVPTCEATGLLPERDHFGREDIEESKVLHNEKELDRLAVRWRSSGALPVSSTSSQESPGSTVYARQGKQGTSV